MFYILNFVYFLKLVFKNVLFVAQFKHFLSIIIVN